MDLLTAVAATTPATTPPGARSRLELTKVFKHLVLLIGLEGTDWLGALHTPNEPSRR